MKWEKATVIVLICVVVFLATLNCWFYLKVMYYEREITAIHSQLETVMKPQLVVSNLDWTDNPYGGDYRLVKASGVVWNLGVWTAHHIDLRLTVYDSNRNKLGDQLYSLCSSLPGKQYYSFKNLTVLYLVPGDGSPITVEAEISYRGFSE